MSSRNAQLVDALGAAAGLLPGRTPVGCCAENADRLSAFFGEDGAGRVDEVAALRCLASLSYPGFAAAVPEAVERAVAAWEGGDGGAAGYVREGDVL